MLYFNHDDIAQIGTPPGPALIGALRISGPNAFAILGRATSGLEAALSSQPRRCTLPCAVLLELSRRRGLGPARRQYACPARAFLMPAPASYTCEDVAEIHLPGAPILLQAALAALVRAGARPAGPGEFTFRAFRNGRLTLGQAEAVEDVIRSANAGECRRALARLNERGRDRVSIWRERTLDLAARVEAVLDFAGEELEVDVVGGILAIAEELAGDGLEIASRPGISDERPHIALVGQANAGKSSLFNALADEDLVLVSPQAATTRDSLRREFEWGGIRFLLSDNPGFQSDGAGAGGKAADRAFHQLGGEDLACWVVDGSRGLSETDREFASHLSGEVIVAVTKCDLPATVTQQSILDLANETKVRVKSIFPVSALTGKGMEELRRALAETVRDLTTTGQWNRREIHELADALADCRAAARELAGAGRLELAAEDLRRAAAAFARTLGDGYAEDALSRIFSSFCIGK